MRFTVYLPDDIGEKAKAADLPLSQIFRRAVEAELRGEDPGPEVTVDRHGKTIELRVRFQAD